jgi:hypothetical protein
MNQLAKKRNVETVFGKGELLAFRKEDSMFLVELLGNTTTTLLYTQTLTIIKDEAENQKKDDSALLVDFKRNPPFQNLTIAKDEAEDPKKDDSALLKDSKGSPIFPMFYKMRMESREFLDQSSQQISSAVKQKNKQWKVSEKVSSVITKSQTNIKSAIAQSRSKSEDDDSFIRTSFGLAKLLEYRESTGTYVLEISFGTLYTQQTPKRITKKKCKATSALELNAAYEMWEKQRRLQLQHECARLNIPFCEETTMHTCVACLGTPKPESKPVLLANAQGTPRFPRLFKLRQNGADMMSARARKKPDTACLLCGSMTCAQHSSAKFRKEGITVCMTCVDHLEYDFTASTDLPEELENRCKSLVNLYSRAVLLLQYFSQFMMETANSLEQNTKQHNEIGVGGSSAGLVSGVLGVAAACTILTPAGPPLLVASLVFGGSATAVQTGSEAYKYYSEPNQLANRILTLQGILDMILENTKYMRDTTLVPYLDQAVLELNAPTATTNTTTLIPKNNAKQVVAVRAGTRMGSTAATSAAAGLVVQDTATVGRFATRASTAAARTARFARFAGGALSAATLVLEARELHNTVDQIKLGNPCEKAQAVRLVHGNLNKLPSTTSVQRMWKSYVKVRAKEMFQQAMLSTSIQVAPEEEQRPPPVADDLLLVEEVVSSLEASQDDGSVSSTTSAATATSTTTFSSSKSRVNNLSSKSSLLERVQRFKERESRKEAHAESLVV